MRIKHQWALLFLACSLCCTLLVFLIPLVVKNHILIGGFTSGTIFAGMSLASLLVLSKENSVKTFRPHALFATLSRAQKITFLIFILLGACLGVALNLALL